MEIENRGIRKLVQDGNLEDAIKNLDTLFQDLVKQPDIVDGAYDIHWLEKHLGMK